MQNWRQWPLAERLKLLDTLEAQERGVASLDGRPASPLDLGKLVFGNAYQDGQHTRYLNQKLVEVASGSTDRLLVMWPPRHFKSETCSHLFPAWYLGTRPDDRVIVAGYGGSFAEEWGRKARNTLEEHGHLFGVKVDQHSRAADRWNIDGRRGGMYTAGIGGPITGRGADCLIIDDPHKDAAEAFSPVTRKRVYDWFQSVAYTRLSPTGRIIVIATRWHQDDLIGMLLKASEHDPGADRWEVVCLPALAEQADPLGRSPGQPLFPERYNLEALNRIRANLHNDYWWHALYQQHPPAELGGVIDVSKLRGFERHGSYYRLFDELDGGNLIATLDSTQCVRVIVVDCAATSEDVAKEAKGRAHSYSVIMVLDISRQGQFMLHHLDRGRWDFPTLTQRAELAYRTYNPAWLGVEDEKTGRALWQSLSRQGYNVRPLATEGKDKLSRAAEFLNRLAQRQVFLDRAATWRKELVSELVLWTGHPDEPADQIDCLAYAVREWQRGQLGRTITLEPVMSLGAYKGDSRVVIGF